MYFSDNSHNTFKQIEFSIFFYFFKHGSLTETIHTPNSPVFPGELGCCPQARGE